jgi:hypothetical protein
VPTTPGNSPPDGDAVAVPVAVGTSLGDSAGVYIASAAALLLLLTVLGPPLLSRLRKGRRT